MGGREFGRSRWAAVGAAVAVTLGGGGLMSASAAIDMGQKAVFVAISPCRIMDTRPSPDGVGSRSTPIGANEVHTIQVVGMQGDCVIAMDAVALTLNVAAIEPSASSFLSVYPGGVQRPATANLNWVASQPPLSNAVSTDISARGTVSFYNLAGTVHVAADVVGYYVDHNHDDRYYTKGQVDMRIADAGGASPGEPGPAGPAGPPGPPGASGPKNHGSTAGPIAAAMSRGSTDTYTFVPAQTTATRSDVPETTPWRFTPQTDMTCIVHADLQLDGGTGPVTGSGAEVSLFVLYDDLSFRRDNSPTAHVVGNGRTGAQHQVSRSAAFSVAAGRPLSFGVELTSVVPQWTSATHVNVVIAYDCG